MKSSKRTYNLIHQRLIVSDTKTNGFKMKLEDALFWRYKTSLDNDWRPTLSKDETEAAAKRLATPSFTNNLDVEALIIDVAPFVCGAGGLAHISQLNQLGWTVPASIFRNTRTMTAMYRTGIILPAIVLSCQAAGIEYVCSTRAV